MADEKPILVVTQIPPNSLVVDNSTNNIVVNQQLPSTVLVAAPLGPSTAGSQGPKGATGATGIQGNTGATGLGLISGGTGWQILVKGSSLDYDTKWVNNDPLQFRVALGNTFGDFEFRGFNSNNVFTDLYELTPGATFSKCFVGGNLSGGGSNSRFWVSTDSKNLPNASLSSFDITKYDSNLSWVGKLDSTNDLNSLFLVGFFRTHSSGSPLDENNLSSYGGIERAVAFYNSGSYWRAVVVQRQSPLVWSVLSGFTTNALVTDINRLQVVVSQRASNVKFYVNGKKVLEYNNFVSAEANQNLYFSGIHGRIINDNPSYAGVTSSILTYEMRGRYYDLDSDLSLNLNNIDYVSSINGSSGGITFTSGPGLFLRQDGNTFSYNFNYSVAGPTGITLPTLSSVAPGSKILVQSKPADNMVLMTVSDFLNIPTLNVPGDFSGSISNLKFALYNPSSGEEFSTGATLVQQQILQDAVTRFNGLTGIVGISGGTFINIIPSGKTLIISTSIANLSDISNAYVFSFNGLTGNVSGVGSLNGLTGTVTNVAFTNQGNTFSVRQVMNAGITTSNLFVVGGATFNSRIQGTGATFTGTVEINTGLVLPNSQNITSAVTLLNGLSGSINLLQGSNITITPGAAGITISSSGGGGSSGGVSTLNGLSGAVNLLQGNNITIISGAAGITINASGGLGSTGATGATGPQGNTGATGPVGDYVISINGSTGAITNVARINEGNTFSVRQVMNAGITTSNLFVVGGATFNSNISAPNIVNSINGFTGTVTNVAFTNQGNTFSVRQIMNAGLSASGGITTDALYITGGNSANNWIGGLLTADSIQSSSFTNINNASFQGNVTISSGGQLRVFGTSGITGTILYLSGGITSMGSIYVNNTANIGESLTIRKSIGFGSDSALIQLTSRDIDSTEFISTISGNIAPTQNTTHFLPSTTGTLLNTASNYVATINGSTGNLNVVTRLNGLSGGVTLAAGSNITLTPSGNIITIAAAAGGGASGGVSSLNGLSGAINLLQGSNITITTGVAGITISSSGGASTVDEDFVIAMAIALG